MIAFAKTAPVGGVGCLFRRGAGGNISNWSLREKGDPRLKEPSERRGTWKPLYWRSRMIEV